jgi:hypothetical protein
MKHMKAWAVGVAFLAGCAQAPAAPATPQQALERTAEQVEFNQWPRDPAAPIYAGFDILETPLAELQPAQLVQDDFDYLSPWQVVTRQLRWRYKNVPLTVICGVGTGSLEQTHRAMVAEIASLAPPGEVLKRDPAAPLVRVTAQDPKVFTGFCRGNIFILFLQPAPALIDPEPLLAQWDKQIQSQPPLFSNLEYLPRILDVKASRKPETLKKDQEIKFTIKLDGPSGFVRTGLEILETHKHQFYVLHSDALHLGVTANAEGTFTVCLWVATRRQLAAVSMQKIVVH